MYCDGKYTETTHDQFARIRSTAAVVIPEAHSHPLDSTFITFETK